MDYSQEALARHKKQGGKWEIKSKFPLESRDDLSVAYTPGVAAVSQAISQDKSLSYDYTMRGNSVAIVSDGSAVLGLGDIGPLAALPVMEGKAILFKKFADIDGVPIVLNSSSVEEIVATVKAIAPTFGGINLEDIKSPKCFEVEEKLQGLGIPVFHDDQHGTAIVILAALINAGKVLNKPLEEMTVVINGAGAAGIAITKMLTCVGHEDGVCIPVKNVLVCDSVGIISRDRSDLNKYKEELLTHSNRDSLSGGLADALRDADCFIGVSKGNLLSKKDIGLMADDPIVFALANPIPEIMPDEALSAGAAIVGTGRSDFPNQINNVLAFPGIFRGALDTRAKKITDKMKIEAAYALAGTVENPTADKILPDPLDMNTARIIAEAVKKVV